MRYQLAVSLVCSALVSTLLAAQSAEVPIPVSPGDSQHAVALSGRCPTFSWGAVGGAGGYELVVYGIGTDEIESRPVLRKRIPGSALSWTPALAECLRSPGRHAWVIRALGKESESRWSSPRLFEIAARPSAEELEAALEIVRRYMEAEEGGSTSGTPDGEEAVEDGAAEPKQQESPPPSALDASVFSVDSSANAQGRSFSGLSFSGQAFTGGSFSGSSFIGSDSSADAIVEGSNAGTGPGVEGEGVSGPGLYGESGSGYGALGESTSGIGVYGRNLTTGTFGYLGSDSNGVFGSSTSGDGVSGSSQSAAGVAGTSQSSIGVQGRNLDSGNYGEVGAVGGGVYGETTLTIFAYGVRGIHIPTSNKGELGTAAAGVEGFTSQSGEFIAGVRGYHLPTLNEGKLGAASEGVRGWSRSGTGVLGTTENGTGVVGESGSTGNSGQLGTPTFGVQGTHASTGNFGQLGAAPYGVQGKHASTGNFGQLGAPSHGVYGETPAAGTGGIGAYGKHLTSGNFGYLGSDSHGVFGSSTSGTAAAGASGTGVGVSGSSTSGTAVEGHHLATGNYGELGAAAFGVLGEASGGSDAVYGRYVVEGITESFGALGGSEHGVYGQTDGDNVAIAGFHNGGSSGVLAALEYGVYGSGSPYAGYFDGDVHVTGTLSKWGGTFVQPHREDPSREIQYAFFEGPEHGVFVRGTARLENGRAIVELPEHFRIVAAEESVQVQATPIEQCKGLYVAGQGRERIEIRELLDGTSDARFNYFVTAVRAGFEGHEPIVANTHFKPGKGESKEEFEARFSGDDPTTRALRSMLIANGLLQEDGTLDMAMVKKLEWEVVGESRSDGASGMPAVASR